MTPLLLTCQFCTAQSKTSLQTIIDLAHQHAITAKMIQTQYMLSLNEYRLFQSGLRPQIALFGNIPQYSHAVQAVSQPDGTIKFIPLSQQLSNVGVSLQQPLSFSGGEISFNTSISRFDDFKGDYKQYNVVPFYLTINQPLFSFNSHRWLKKINPLKLEEAKKTFSMESERINLMVVSLYFNLLSAQEELTIQEQNMKEIEKNYLIEQERITLGTTSRIKLSELNLQKLEAKQFYNKAHFELNTARLNLQVYTGSINWGGTVLEYPINLPCLKADLDTILERAVRSRPEIIRNQINQLESESNLAQAKAQYRQISASATVGFNNSADRLIPAYNSLKDQQLISVGFNIPIVDWGRKKSSYQTALASQKLIELQARLKESEIKEEISTLFNNLILVQSNIALARQTDSAAHKNYLLTYEQYVTGQYNLLELSAALQKKNSATRNYLSALRDYWISYYTLRMLTGYEPPQQTSTIRN